MVFALKSLYLVILICLDIFHDDECLHRFRIVRLSNCKVSFGSENKKLIKKLKISCLIMKLLVPVADPSFLLKRHVSPFYGKDTFMRYKLSAFSMNDS